MKYCYALFGILLLLYSCGTGSRDIIGKTTITRWKDDKRAAISITYDDGTINQFTVARPIMNKLGFPATFYILTGKIEGSARGKFIGRPIKEIIAETVSVKTNQDNFFERASAIGFVGKGEAFSYHSKAGSLFEAGHVTEAYTTIDEGFEKIRTGGSELLDEFDYNKYSVDTTTWRDLEEYALEGHEIASHTITHPRLAVLDEANMLYELEQSKADIRRFLGDRYTFSAECPYGTEDERVMKYAHTIYPALRNRMPAPYLEELNRSSVQHPGASEKEYVQWQRGPLTNVSMDVMKSWVDTCIVHDNVWLVLVFHGVDGIGWEPRTGEELEEYFNYMKQKEEHLWIATFADVTKYIKVRESTSIKSEINHNQIILNVSSDLDPGIYDVPITLKTYVPEKWESVYIHTDINRESRTSVEIKNDANGNFALYSIPISIGKIYLEENL
jgi:peptidoglycan/xylan/chitin deacetylase (PgdA/CDA1 family)